MWDKQVLEVRLKSEYHEISSVETYKGDRSAIKCTEQCIACPKNPDSSWEGECEEENKLETHTAKKRTMRLAIPAEWCPVEPPKLVRSQKDKGRPTE
jgi:hypothetical protein